MPKQATTAVTDKLWAKVKSKQTYSEAQHQVREQQPVRRGGKS